MGVFFSGGVAMYYLSEWSSSPEYMNRDYLNRILAAIADEQMAAQFYGRLQAEAPASLARKYLEHARRDEINHRQMLSRLYFTLTGTQPKVAGKSMPQWRSFKEGLQMALDGELEAAEEYRDLYLASTYPFARDVFFELMTDEMEHATRFTRLMID